MVQGKSLNLPLSLLLRPLAATLVAVGAVAVGLSSIPQHDVMVEVKYWWECLMIQCNIVWMTMTAMLFTTTSESVLNLDNVLSWKNAVFTYICGFTLHTMSWAGMSFFWVFVLGLRYPVPIIGIWNQFLGLGSQIATVWFGLPKHWRSVRSFKTRGKWLTVYHVYGILISGFYWVIWIILTYIPKDYQPIMAVVLPVCREIVLELLQKIGKIVGATISTLLVLVHRYKGLWEGGGSSLHTAGLRPHDITDPRALPLDLCWLSGHQAHHLPAPRH